MKVGTWIVWLILLVPMYAYAQESATQETNPPYLKWYQINSPGFNVLYPDGFEPQAQRLTSILEAIRIPEGASLGVKPKRISIILQSQSSYSNAFVTLAPRHSEFFGMPSQNYNLSGNTDWLKFLASHEYRHVVQFQRSLTGFTKFVHTLFGQNAQAGLAYIAAPQWFWEGDAVATETAFTHGGRGRIPNFDLLFRTNLMEGRTFNYHKQYLRSYKDNISNHYVIGYHMVSYVRKKTGDPKIWERIVKRAWGVPFIPFTFSNAIKKETGLYVTQLYQEMASALKAEWTKDLASVQLTSFIPVNHRSSTTYTDYLYPALLPDGRVVAQKTGLDDIEKLVVVSQGADHKAFVQGPMNSTGMMSSGANRVVWNEFRFDPRWLMKTFSVVKAYDFETGKSTTISTKSRYGGAALSPDGKSVATVETGTDYQTKLVVLDYASGRVILDFANPANDFISMPHWAADGKSIFALKTGKNGKTISRFDVTSRETVELAQFGEENIGYPVPYKRYIFYNSPYSGIDNINVLDSESGKRFQVTSSRYGSYNPAVSADGSTLYYNEQTRLGLDVVKVPLDEAAWRPLDQIKRSKGQYESVVEQEGRSGLLDSVITKAYTPRRYHRAGGMINPHSWGPYFTNSLTQAQFGIYSNDILSTTSINAGYLFDINERTGTWQAGVSYQGFYPIIDFQIYSGNRVDKTTAFGYKAKFDWSESGTSIGLRVPLVFTRSKYYSQLEIGNTAAVTQVYSYQSELKKGDTIVHTGTDRFVPVTINVGGNPVDVQFLLADRLSNGTLLSNFFHFSYIHSLKLSYRDFNPKFGQYLFLEDYRTPFGGDFKGHLWTVNGVAYFPGVAKHHSLYFRGGYQSSLTGPDINTYVFRSRLFKPRGYSYPNDDTFYTISTNYQFPLWYPDIALGPLVNFQRVKANLFYDYGQGNRNYYFYDFPNDVTYFTSQKINYGSAGVELTFDMNIMRLLPQIELGIRITHIGANPNYNSGMVYEFLIGNIPF